MLRSILYAHLSESLSGLSTIRSYNEVPRFVRDSKYYIDLEDRALALTCVLFPILFPEVFSDLRLPLFPSRVTNQRYVLPLTLTVDGVIDKIFRWMAIRLDFMGSFMVLIVSYF